MKLYILLVINGILRLDTRLLKSRVKSKRQIRSSFRSTNRRISSTSKGVGGLGKIQVSLRSARTLVKLMIYMLQ